MRCFSLALSAAALLAAFAHSAPASAQSTANTCTIETQEVDFGDYDVFTRARTKGVGRIIFRCVGFAASTPLHISVSEGSSEDFDRRTMHSGPDVIGYNLYIDSARRRIAGNGFGGTFLLERATHAVSGRIAAFTIYGAIEPRQMIPPGFYSDEVRIVVEF